MGQLYVKVAFPPESKAKMEKLIGNLSDALKLRIENLAWMSPETKEKALEKWKTFDPRVGYPDKWRDWTGLETGRARYLADRKSDVSGKSESVRVDLGGGRILKQNEQQANR